MDEKQTNAIKEYWLFLDDERTPIMAYQYTRRWQYTMKDSWVIVRNYDEFVATITERGLPTLVSFDHDLSNEHYNYLHGEIPYEDFIEKTGKQCANWLVDYCLDNKLKLPEYLVHSMNPAGAENIKGLLNNFKKFQNQNEIN
jgi:hypothetical protein